MTGEALMMTRPIVVGVDGSSDSTNALAWAADEAALRRSPLRVVCADLGGPRAEAGSPEPGRAEPYPEAQLLAAARRVVVAAAQEARRNHPDLRVRAIAAPGWPVQVLLNESVRASLLVVGSRALSPVRDIWLGAVSRPVVQQSACPVVVVRVRVSRSLRDMRVVVGVDRSSSDDALALAFEEARLWQSGLTVVHAWEATPPVWARLSWSVDRQKRERDERQRLDEMLRPWRQRYPDVDVVRYVVDDEPASRLVRLSQNARLLVVGSRGRGPMSALVLGSVSMAAVQQAGCPVVVIQHRHAEDDLGDLPRRGRAPRASAPLPPR